MQQYTNLEAVGFCAIHDDQCCYIYFDQINKVKLLCNQCFLMSPEYNDKKRLVYLKNIEKRPEQFCTQVIDNKEFELKEFFQRLGQIQIEILEKKLNKLVDAFVSFQEQLGRQIEEIKSFKNVLITNIEQLRLELNKTINLSDLINKLEQDSTQGSTKSTIQLSKESQFSELSNEISKKLQNFKTIKETYQKSFIEAQQSSIKFTDIQKQFTNLYNQQNELITSLIQQFSGLSEKILDRTKFQELLSKINNGQSNLLKEFKPIKGQQQFWDILENKQKILMIFKAQNNCIFGGYNPLTWVKPKQGPPQNQPPLNQEEKKKYFIFYSTDQQLQCASIKQDQPVTSTSIDINTFSFGKEDLQISNDFTIATSKITNYQFQRPSLFEQNNQTIEIQQVEIYEII